MPLDLNMIRALIAQEPLGTLHAVQKIVCEEIDHNIRIAASQQTARAVPRIPVDRTDEYELRQDNLKMNTAVDRALQQGQQAGKLYENAGFKSDLHVSASGATSSHVPLRYDLIPRALIEIAARRYTDGAEKHGERGYQKGLTDRDFIINRINHITEHWNKLFHCNDESDERESPADHLGAILWGLGFLCELTYNSQSYKLFRQIQEDGMVRTI